MFICTQCDQPARFIHCPSQGFEIYSHCGLTFYRTRNPFNGEWETSAVTFGEEGTELPEVFKKALSTFQ